MFGGVYLKLGFATEHSNGVYLTLEFFHNGNLKGGKRTILELINNLVFALTRDRISHLVITSHTRNH